MKGRTKWRQRYEPPTQNGEYECIVRLPGGARTRWMLHWDGRGFLVPFPMLVLRWRGMTKKAHDERVRELQRQRPVGEMTASKQTRSKK